jgi:hypothetical protein
MRQSETNVMNSFQNDFDFAFAGQEVFALVLAFDTIALYCLQLPFFV